MGDVPALRIAVENGAPVRCERAYVLYWMIAARRAHRNFALDRAVEWARDLDRPIVVVEALRADYPWASDRLHRFILDGMRDNRDAFADSAALYYPYVEPRRRAARGLLRELAKRACVVVTDSFPAFFLPAMVRAAARRLDVRLESIDSNGVLPLRAARRAFPTAFGFRAFLQRELAPHLAAFPRRDPLAVPGLRRLDALPDRFVARYPSAAEPLLAGDLDSLARLPIDHGVRCSAMRGGSGAGRARLTRFVARHLDRYAEDRGEPLRDGTSRLSPYLHFGHVSTHEIVDCVLCHEGVRRVGFTPRRLGGRRGSFGVDAGAEAFLDELVTWRELAYVAAAHDPHFESYDSLPVWAHATLAAHAGDPRPVVYTTSELEAAATHDEVWNGAQRELVETGWFHNVLRMLWGKKILEWSPSPEAAFATMAHLMNKYALDGRDPNSYAGYGWVLGRFDRPWGPERPIFGTVRYMSSESTARKARLRRAA